MPGTVLRLDKKDRAQLGNSPVCGLLNMVMPVDEIHTQSSRVPREVLQQSRAESARHLGSTRELHRVISHTVRETSVEDSQDKWGRD